MLACELCVCTPSTYTSIFCDTRLVTYTAFSSTRAERVRSVCALKVKQCVTLTTVTLCEVKNCTRPYAVRVLREQLATASSAA